MKKLILLLLPFCSNAQKVDSTLRLTQFSSPMPIKMGNEVYSAPNISLPIGTKINFVSNSVVFLVIKDSIIYIDSVFANRKIVFKKLN